MNECINKKRAEWAENALQLFCEETGVQTDGDGYDSAIADLICDLRHLADRKDVSFHDIMERVEMHYETEITHEDCEECQEAEESDLLTAAAPDLLKTLKEIVRIHSSTVPGCYDDFENAFKAARVAIKKAEGEKKI